MNNQSIPHEIIFPKEYLDVYFKLFHDESSFVSTHWHNSLEIIYVTSGNLNVKMGDQLIELYDDDIIISSSGRYFRNVFNVLQVKFDKQDEPASRFTCHELKSPCNPST